MKTVDDAGDARRMCVHCQGGWRCFRGAKGDGWGSERLAVLDPCNRKGVHELDVLSRLPRLTSLDLSHGLGVEHGGLRNLSPISSLTETILEIVSPSRPPAFSTWCGKSKILIPPAFRPKFRR